ncbi:ATP synthase F0 subunit B [Streptomyces sp. bgisy034]|uniref:ATP synthase F0 subunit B n=1 Tax=Streptomyces sp. bgisy034 TaxID=3413774 RepID=UPI003EB76512
MPSTNTRHLATSALCAALLLGTAAAPALAAPPDSGRTAVRSQTPALAGLGTALTPVTHLLNSSVYADDDPLTEAEAKELADAVAEARKEIDAALKEAEQARKDAEQARMDALAEARKEIDAALKEAEQARKDAEQARTDALAEAQKEIDAALKEVEAAKKEALAEAAAAIAEATAETTTETATGTSTGTTTTQTTESASQTTNFTSDALGVLGKTLSDLLSALTSLGSQEEVDTSADNVLTSLVNVKVATQLDRELPAA